MAYERLTWLDDDGSLTVGTLYSAAIMNRIETGINELHVGHDAVSNSAEFNKAEAFTWTHTPVATNPKGILVFVVQDTESGVAADQISTVTYGGVAMTEVASSPFLKTLGANDAVLHAFFLGVGVPAGAQTVSVTSTGTQKKRAVAISLQGSKDLRVEAVKTTEAEATELSASATTATGQESVSYGVIQAGATAVGEIAPAAGMTELYEAAIATTRAMSVLRKTANGTGGAQAVTWTFSAKKAVGAFVVAIGPVRDFGIVTTLPTIPGIGDHCHYVADKTNSVIWDLVYDGEGEYPWKKIGGPPLISKTSTENSTASTTYVTLENSPSITTPVKMTANVRIGGQVINTGAQGFVFWTLFTSGGSEIASAAWGSNSVAPHGSNIFTGVILAASTTYTLRYKTSAGTTFPSGRYIEIDPVRVA